MPVLHSKSKYTVAMSQPLFTRHYLSPKYHVKIIKSFSKQSIWSSKAQSLNATLGTQLGTLVHLPFEVRQQIYKHVFDNYYPSVPKTFDYLGCARPELDDPLIKDHPVGGVFELDSYNIISEQGFVVNLAHASPTLKDEFEHFFLFSNDFKFQCPKKLSEFLGQLSNSHRAQRKQLSMPLPLFSFSFPFPFTISFEPQDIFGEAEITVLLLKHLYQT